MSKTGVRRKIEETEARAKVTIYEIVHLVSSSTPERLEAVGRLVDGAIQKLKTESTKIRGIANVKENPA